MFFVCLFVCLYFQDRRDFKGGRDPPKYKIRKEHRGFRFQLKNPCNSSERPGAEVETETHKKDVPETGFAESSKGKGEEETRFAETGGQVVQSEKRVRKKTNDKDETERRRVEPNTEAPSEEEKKKDKTAKRKKKQANKSEQRKIHDREIEKNIVEESRSKRKEGEQRSRDRVKVKKTRKERLKQPGVSAIRDSRSGVLAIETHKKRSKRPRTEEEDVGLMLTSSFGKTEVGTGAESTW